MHSNRYLPFSVFVVGAHVFCLLGPSALAGLAPEELKREVIAKAIQLVDLRERPGDRLEIAAKMTPEANAERERVVANVVALWRDSHALPMNKIVTVPYVSAEGKRAVVNFPLADLLRAALFPNPFPYELREKLSAAPKWLMQQMGSARSALASGSEPTTVLKSVAQVAVKDIFTPADSPTLLRAAEPVHTPDGQQRTYYLQNFDLARTRYVAGARVPYTESPPAQTLFITDDFRNDYSADIYGRRIDGPISAGNVQGAMKALARPDDLNYVPIGPSLINALDANAARAGITRDIAVANYLCERALQFAQTLPGKHIPTIVSVGHANERGIGLFDSTTLRDDNSLKDNNALLTRLLACFEEKGITVGQWRAFGCHSGTNADRSVPSTWSSPRTLAYGLSGRDNQPTQVVGIDGFAAFSADGGIFIQNQLGQNIEGDLVTVSRKAHPAVSTEVRPVREYVLTHPHATQEQPPAPGGQGTTH